MKKQALIILNFILLATLISLASAAEIKLSKETYSPGETLQAEIYGNFLDSIKPENIVFYRERNIPVDYDILKTKDKYLLYALLPAKEGNYTIKIKSTRYETETGVNTELVKEFSIKAGNETILSFNPGFIVTKEDFYIQVKANKNTNINTEFLEEKQNLSLVENQEKKIYFSVEEIENYTEAKIKLNSYEIPVFIFPEGNNIIIETNKFRFSPLELSAVILKGDSYFFEISLINLGRKNIENIAIFSNVSEELDINISPSSISLLEPGKGEFINLTLNSKELGNFSGSILASSENLSASLHLKIDITKNISEVNISSAYTGEESCEDLGGEVCNAEQRCEGTLVFTTEGYCCKGKCTEKKESSYTWIYGIIILIIVVIGLIFLSKFMKKKQGKGKDVLKEKEKEYAERMSGEEKEVRRSLARV